MASTYSRKLKDPRVCRVFFSSPFNGMEGEREALTKLYWPRLQSFCASKGVQFRAVDMRWGITSEASDDAQVVNICLRELDRSDMFAGFFGQRYGWHGASDEALQKNFDNAQGRYPWLAEHRDKSVTEIEFLHGHLNHPGELPACFAFRNKAYDDIHREEGVKAANKRTIYKFSAESDQAFQMLLDLKERVNNTEDKTLGVWMAYDTPEEGAKFMFDRVWAHLTEVLLADPVGPSPSVREMTRFSHDAYMASRSGVYIGGEAYFKQLDDFLCADDSKENSRPLLVMGESGCGKSALLCNWISHLQESASQYVLLYHFVGSDKESTSVNAVLQRMIRELKHAVRKNSNQEGKTVENENHEQTSSGIPIDNSGMEKDPSEDPDKDLLGMSTEDLSSNLSQALSEFKQTPEKAIIVVDGLNKMDSTGKIARPLFWFPKSLPTNVLFVLATSSDDVTNVEELQDNRKCHTMPVAPLSQEIKKDLCLALLKENSKDLSPNQLEMIITCQQTENPLFLKIFIEELCTFGNFRKLTGKIEDLVNSQGIPDLFRQFLERLEADYNTADHPDIVQQVLCGIFVSQSGLTENQILAAYNITSNVWSPMFFALDKYLVNRSGALGFTFTELKDAVEKRYLSNECERLKHTKFLADFFGKELQELISKDAHVTSQEIEETLYLLQQAGQTIPLRTALAQVPVLKHMVKYARYSFLSYWHSTELSAAQIGARCVKEMDQYLADNYNKYINGRIQSTLPAKNEVHALLQELNDFFTMAKLYRGAILVSERLIRLQKNTSAGFQDDIGVYDFKYELACTYVMLGEYEEGKALHEEVLDFREKWHQVQKIDPAKLATSYHGLGSLYFLTKDYEKAEPLLQRSFEMHKGLGEKGSALNISASLNCLGILHTEQGLYDKALEELQEARRVEEEYYAAEFNPKLAQTMFNLALLYRRKGDLDEAEKIYRRSLTISVNALGTKHQDVGMCYLNLGTTEMARGNMESAEVNYKKSVEIFEATMEPDFFQLVMAKESLASAMAQQDPPKYEEAEPVFLEVLSILERKGTMDNCLPWLHKMYINYYQDTKQYAKASRILVALINSKHTSGLMYIALRNCDYNTPSEERPTRSDDYSLEAALEKWPTDDSLIATHLMSDLIPNKDIAGMKQLCNRYVESLSSAEQTSEEDSTGSEIYVRVLETLKQQEDMKEVELVIAEEAIELYPKHLDLILAYSIILDGVGRPQEAFSWMKKLCVELTDTMNPVLPCLVAQRAIKEGDLLYAKDLIGRIAQQWKDEQTSLTLKQLEDMLESAQSS